MLIRLQILVLALATVYLLLTLGLKLFFIALAFSIVFISVAKMYFGRKQYFKHAKEELFSKKTINVKAEVSETEEEAVNQKG